VDRGRKFFCRACFTGGTNPNPVAGERQLFGFLTTEANDVVTGQRASLKLGALDPVSRAASVSYCLGHCAGWRRDLESTADILGAAQQYRDTAVRMRQEIVAGTLPLRPGLTQEHALEIPDDSIAL
jgi:hypothetical protein